MQLVAREQGAFQSSAFFKALELPKTSEACAGRLVALHVESQLWPAMTSRMGLLHPKTRDKLSQRAI